MNSFASWKNVFPKFLWLAATIFLSINVAAQQERSNSTVDAEPPKVGLRVLEVLAGSPAAAAGLQSMDIITQYGDSQVVDAASYFAARDAYQRSRGAGVEIVYWRGRQRMRSIIRPGRMGIQFNEYNSVSYQLDSLMQKLNILIEAPDYVSEVQVAKGTLPSREKLAEQIEAAIKKAAADGGLTPTQVLVAKINAIPDDATPPEQERQSELLTELVSTQPLSFTEYLGYEVFFKHKRYRAATACFKRSLEANSGDAGVRLNLGIAYSHLQMFAEADAAADYVLKHDTGLTEHGYLVVFQVKATAALGQRDFAKALDYADQAFRLNPTSGYLMALWELSAAQVGDLQKFYDITAASEKAMPSQYAVLRSRIDAVEAYVLLKNNQTEKARALVSKWGGTPDPDANAKYWRQYPTGDDIVKTWKYLQGPL